MKSLPCRFYAVQLLVVLSVMCFVGFVSGARAEDNVQIENVSSVEFGIRGEFIVVPAQALGFGIGGSAEYRFASQGLGLRLSAAYPLEVALDVLYRLNQKNSEGPLYVGLGLGLANGLEGRVVVGYAWRLEQNLNAFFEANACMPFLNWQPRLEFVIGLSYGFLR